MNKTFIGLLIMILLIPVTIRAEEVTLTLDEAITIALRDNRDVLLKEEDLKKAKAMIAEAKAGLRPALDVSAGFIEARGLYAKDFGTYATQIGAKQILYAGGKLINAIKISEYAYSASAAVLDRVKLETILNTKKAFYTLLLSVRYAAMNKTIMENTLEHLDFIRARFANGESSESDLIKMQSALATVTQAYEASLNLALTAQASLINLLYFDQGIKVNPSGDLVYEGREIAFDQAFLKALQARPEIKQLEAQKQAAQKGVEIAKAGNSPTVLASWDYYSRSHQSAGTAKGWNDYNLLGIAVSWPVFDGWLTKSKVEQAIVDLKEAQLLQEKTIKDITLEMKASYLELKNAVEKIKPSSEQINLYKNNLAVIEAKYQAGMASLLDLHDAQASYAVALFNQIQANYDYLVAKAKFDKASGGQ